MGWRPDRRGLSLAACCQRGGSHLDQCVSTGLSVIAGIALLGLAILFLTEADLADHQKQTCVLSITGISEVTTQQPEALHARLRVQRPRR